MTADKHNISRRQTLVGIGLAGATAIVPVAGATIAKAAQGDRSTFDAAVARLRLADAELQQLDAALTSAHDAAEAACPRMDEFFKRYGLGAGWSYDRNYRAAHMSLVIERSKGRHSTPQEAKQISADAYRVVDDFETYCARRDEAFRGYDKLENRFDAVVDERSNARNDLLDTPAPDQAAMLVKIELLAAILDEVSSEDAESIAAVRNDARRLLARG